MTTSISLYEKINYHKLEQVLDCSNIPFNEGEDDIEWFNIFKKSLIKYKNLKEYKNKGKLVIYKQKNSYGRFMAVDGVSLQMFQKDVRKYLCNEFYEDVDIVNCHPVLLKQVLEKNDIVECKMLNDYIEDREKFIKTYNLKSKVDFIKIINNENLFNINFKDIHDKIYKKLVPKLIKEHKLLFNRIKRECNKKNKGNVMGSFFSLYLQNLENNILQSMFKALNEKGFKIGVLCFDGLMIEKTELLNKDLFRELEDNILNQTGYSVNLCFKSMETNWKPIKEKVSIEVKENPNFEIYSRRTAEVLFKQIKNKKTDEYNEEEYLEFTEYINKFCCIVNEPDAYGFRDNTLKYFETKTSNKFTDRVGPLWVNAWKNSDDKLVYDKFVFIVDESDKTLKQNVYNTYQRPSYKKPEINELKSISPLVYDYLYRIISDNCPKMFNCIINYMSKIVNVGQSKMCLVLLGRKGIGKSSICEILAYLIGKDEEQYYNKFEDFTQLMNKFNADMMTSIITAIEELPTNAGSYHEVHSKLKSLITEKITIFEKKGIDRFKGKSVNNFVLMTNGINPVPITEDNRRFIVCQVNEVERNNSCYFVRMKKEMVEKIEELRYFFKNYPYIDDINSIRPITETEKDLIALNQDITTRFLLNEIDSIFEDDEKIDFDILYNRYVGYCRVEGKKNLSKPYFSSYLRRTGEFNYERVKEFHSHSTYISKKN